MLAGGFNLLLQAADHSDSDGSVGIQSDNNKGLNINLGSSVGINNSQAVSSRSLLYSNFITAMNNNNHSSSVGELYHPQSQSTSLPPQPAKRTFDSNASLGPPKKRIRNHHASLISLSSASTLGTWRGSYNSHIPNVSGGSNSSMSSPSMKKNEEWGTFKQDSPTVITSSGSTTAADVTADTTKDSMLRREKDIRQLFNMSLIVPKEKAPPQRVPSKNKNKSGNKKRRLSHSSKTKKKKELDCKDVNGNDICMGFFSMLSSQKSSTDEAGSKPPPQEEDDSVTSSDKDQEQEEVVVPVPQSPKEEQEEASDSQVKNEQQEKDDTHTEAFKLSLRKAYLKALRERFGEE